MPRQYNTHGAQGTLALAVQRGGIGSIPCGMVSEHAYQPRGHGAKVQPDMRRRVRNVGCRTARWDTACQRTVRYCRVLPGHCRVLPRWRTLQGIAARSGAALDRLLRVARRRKYERELLVGKPLRLQVRHTPPYIERLLHSTDAIGSMGPGARILVRQTRTILSDAGAVIHHS